MAGNKYIKKARAFSFKDIMAQYGEIKRKYNKVQVSAHKGKVEIFIQLQPTAESPMYTIKIVTKEWEPAVNVFVVEPDISKYARCKDNKIPHTYLDGSICLYLPNHNEWSYHDSWAETLIPWTCLWLYYFEIWLMTGEWLGGGVHPGDSETTTNN